MKFYKEWIETNPNIPIISDFDDLLKEVLYAYEDRYPIYKTKEGFYIIHKLTVGKNFMEYKGSYSKLSPGLYEQLDKFFTIERE